MALENRTPWLGSGSLARTGGVAGVLVWPAWPLTLWTLWCWRNRIVGKTLNRHLLVPLWFTATTVTASLVTGGSDRTLLLASPSLATLAAFALPTLKRQMAAWIDWFTLFFLFRLRLHHLGGVDRNANRGTPACRQRGAAGTTVSSQLLICYIFDSCLRNPGYGPGL